eukprot:3593111-Rhodomonas_salina.1
MCKSGGAISSFWWGDVGVLAGPGKVPVLGKIWGWKIGLGNWTARQTGQYCQSVSRRPIHGQCTRLEHVTVVVLVRWYYY